MRLTLIHKPDAGEGRHSAEELEGLLTAAGHDVIYASTDANWESALHDPGDLVLIGGGDGTVSNVARSLIGTDTPFAILPLGTANNIATRLG